jgi:hypothetical protein
MRWRSPTVIARNRLTTEYLSWPLTDDEITVASGTTAVDFAFKLVSALGLSDTPSDADWEQGIIADNGAEADPRYDFAILIGPEGGLELGNGLYRVWIRITDGDGEERPVRAIDWLEIG